MVCKDRQDSFVGEESNLWEDSRLEEDTSFHVNEPLSKEWSRNLSQRASRPATVITPRPVITPSRSRKKKNNLCSEDSHYGDENRPTNANVVESSDRKQAMKLATRPLIAIAESPSFRRSCELSPRLSDKASAQLKRTNSTQRRSTNSMQLSPRSVVTSPACTKSQRQLSPHHTDGSQTPGRQTPGLSRPPSFSLGPLAFSLGSPVAGHSRPRAEGYSSPRAGKGPSPRAYAHSPSQNSSHQADWPTLEPFVVYEPRGGSVSHASPRGGSDSYVQPSQGQADEWWLARGGTDSYAPAAVGLQARQTSPRGPDSFVPPGIQPRAMARVPSSDVHARALSSATLLSKTPMSLRLHGTSSSSLLSSGTDRVHKTMVVAPKNGLVRDSSHDSEVFEEGTRSARRCGGVSGHHTPDTNFWTPRLSPRLSDIAGDGLMGGLIRPAQRNVARARSASLFWRPPPEAAFICESMRSPSFILCAKAEAAARSEASMREATDVSTLSDTVECSGSGGQRIYPSQAKLGRSSSTAVAAVVCTTLGVHSQCAPSPSMGHRGVKPSPVSFSYAAPRIEGNTPTRRQLR